MTTYSNYTHLVVGIYIAIVMSVVSPVQAQTTKGLFSSKPTASSWVKTKNAQSRLISAYLVSDAKNIIGGIEIKLRPNWKTYWRVPGDAGLPPRFDFSKSENLEKAEISWPGPKRYIDKFGVAIGYKDHVIFPVRVTPKDPKKPVKLRLKLDYAACDDICIPLTAEHELTYKIGDVLEGPHHALVDSFVSAVPVNISKEKNLKIIGIRFVSKSDEKYLVLDLRSKIGFRQPEIFIEGSEALYFRTPKLDSKPTVVSRWHVPISGDTDEHPVTGTTVKMTFIDGERRVEADYEIKNK